MRVELANVGKRFGAARALDSVTVAFESCSVHVFRGSNGSGKSTLLSIIGLLMTPSSGAVTIDGNASNRSAAERARIGYLGHESGLYMDGTARENIELFAALRGVDPVVAVDRAQTELGIGAILTRTARTCSRGQVQRIALACALVHQPAVIVLDEPTTGLDADGIATLAEALLRRVAAGALLIVATHELDFLRAADPVTHVLQNGRIVS